MMQLREYLYQKRINVKQFSEKINYSRSHLSSVMNGLLTPSKKMVRIIYSETEGQVTENEIADNEKKEK